MACRVSLTYPSITTKGTNPATRKRAGPHGAVARPGEQSPGGAPGPELGWCPRNLDLHAAGSLNGAKAKHLQRPDGKGLRGQGGRHPLFPRRIVELGGHSWSRGTGLSGDAKGGLPSTTRGQ